MCPRQGDIYLVPIPFSDLRASKRRPVLVISNDTYHSQQQDCLVMALTSRIDPTHAYGLPVGPGDISDGLLPRESQLRADKIFSVHQRILIHRFGVLSSGKFTAAIALLNELVQRG